MAETIMGQGMNGWLKRECFDTGMELLALSQDVAEIRDYLYQDKILTARRTLDMDVKPRLEHHVQLGHLDSTLPIFNKINEAINDFEAGDSTNKVRAIISVGNVVGMVNWMALEKTAKCQCGEAMEIEKKLGTEALKKIITEGYITITNPGDTIFQTGDIISGTSFISENDRVVLLGLNPAESK